MWPILIVPHDRHVSVNVLAPLNVCVPVPVLIRPPLPEMTPA